LYLRSLALLFSWEWESFVFLEIALRCGLDFFGVWSLLRLPFLDPRSIFSLCTENKSQILLFRNGIPLELVYGFFVHDWNQSIYIAAEAAVLI